jgi:ribosome biogenesis GTPase
LLPELAAVRTGCGYRSCLHEREGDCAVRAAVAAGNIPPSRYASYLMMLARAQEEEQPPSRSSRGQARGGGRRRPSR